MTTSTCVIDDLLPNAIGAYRHTCTCMLLIYHVLSTIFIIRCLDGIPECVIAQFHEAAEELIEEKGATNAVAAALAYIAGAKDIVSRSLLSAHQVCHNTV